MRLLSVQRCELSADPHAGILSSKGRVEIDPFDLAQLRKVARVCRTSSSLSEAGRTLFRRFAQNLEALPMTLTVSASILLASA